MGRSDRCIVCGRHRPGWMNPHHRVPRSFKGRRRSDNWNPDTPGNVVTICMDDHALYHSSIYVGQVPYEGPARFKQQGLARRIDKLLHLNIRFWLVLPRFAQAYWRKWMSRESEIDVGKLREIERGAE